VLGAGEGAVVVCGSDEMAKALQTWSNFGFDGNRKSLSIGTNAKISEIACAYGLTSLRMRETEIQEWESALAATALASDGKRWQTFISSLPGIRPYWIARFQDKTIRDLVISELEIAGIQSRKWWASPLSQMPAFESFVPARPNPNSQNLADTTLGLPIFRGLSSNQAQKIVSSIDHILEIEKVN
jgi:dTDP-4-amino-4,6-dideoxygalactose transaminase